MSKHKAIHGSHFLMKLVEAGVIRIEDHIRRVVIDAPDDGATKLYVERYGDDRMLGVSTTLEGIEIVNVNVQTGEA